MIDDAYVAGLIEFIKEKFGNDLLAVLAGGSRVGGTNDPSSDLDLVVVVATSKFRRWHFVYRGIKVDAFIYLPAELRLALADGRTDGRAAMAHLLAAGQIVHDRNSTLPLLQQEAKAILGDGPPVATNQDRFHIRYNSTMAMRDLADVEAKETERVVFLIGVILSMLLDQHYRLARRWPKKKKHMLADLALWDPHAADLVRRACNTKAPLQDRCTAALALGTHVLAPVGGPLPAEWIA